MPVHARSSFESVYAGQPQWEIGPPQQALRAAADRVTGSVADAGCGPGENALFFAARGQKVTGIGFPAEPITLAKHKAAERGLTATFLVMDALALWDPPEVFDSVIDSGLFHVFSDEDRRRYVEGLASVLKPGGRLFLLCFSDQDPGEQGPRRVSRPEIADAFARYWIVESIDPARFEVRPDLKDIQFGERRPVELFGHVEGLPPVPGQDRLQHLDPRLVRFGQETREPALHPPAHPDRQRRLPLVDAEQVGDVGPLLRRGARRQDRGREADALGHLPAQLDLLDPESGRQDLFAGLSDLGRLVGRGARNSNSGRSGRRESISQ
jgi:SAM-dependent methyltransferase